MSEIDSDSYDEESFADEQTPWDDEPEPEVGESEVEEGRFNPGGKRADEASYEEVRDGGAAGEQGEEDTGPLEQKTPRPWSGDLGDDGAGFGEHHHRGFGLRRSPKWGQPDEYERLARRNRKLADGSTYRTFGEDGVSESSVVGASEHRSPSKPRLKSRGPGRRFGPRKPYKRLAPMIEQQFIEQRPGNVPVIGDTPVEPADRDAEYDASMTILVRLIAEGLHKNAVPAQHIESLERRKHQTRKEREEVAALKERRQEVLDRVEREVEFAKKKIYGEETRGGARQRRYYGKAKRVFPGDLTGGTCYRFDFHAKQQGKGGARDDKRAIEEWLCAELVERDDRRWILTRADRKYELADLKQALAPGPKGSGARRKLADEIAVRAKELKGDGAYVSHIATVLEIDRNTIGRWLK